MKIIDLLRKGAEKLPLRDVETLLSAVLGMSRAGLHLRREQLVEDDRVALWQVALTRRLNGEPWQYIIGEVEFAGVVLNVTPSVLIPRQETEILVEKIAKTLSSEKLEGKVLWDLCTGSGCIGIALKKRFPVLSVVLSDISLEALEVAGENAQKNGCDVGLLHGDLWAPFQGKQCDYLVSNPPYINQKDFENLDPEVRCHEPKLALLGGDDGLDLYRRLAEKLHEHLKVGGKAWFEVGAGQGSAIEQIFAQGGWQKGVVEADWAGCDRFFSLERDFYFR